MIGTSTPGKRIHRVTLQNPGPAVPTEDGFTQSWTDLVPPTWTVSIERAAATDLERIAAGAVVASASHLIEGPYHAQVTTKTRVLFNGRTFHVTAVINPGERNVDLKLACEEVIA
jgi:SPP1 family predicted phage head-tail adaptor